jgi:hypothetical protein
MGDSLITNGTASGSTEQEAANGEELHRFSHRERPSR